MYDLGLTSSDPIHQCEGEWYFWDEVWMNQIGPFETEEDAREACRDYAEKL